VEAPKTPMSPVARRASVLVGIIVVVLVAGLGLWAWTSAQAPAPPAEKPPLTAAEVLSEVRVSATVVDHSLAATHAVADFGIAEGVRLVRVRILDELQLELRVESGVDLALAGPPRVCLVGPYSAPDDGGLTDRCWGDPDLAGLLAAKLATDAGGHPTLDATQAPLIVAASLRRGEVRCDYPPGDWQLEVTLEPLVDGVSLGVIDLPSIALSVPADAEDPTPLPLTESRRYCGLATAVYREQGEPPVVAP
jgi:hypothetical protein